MKITKIVAQQKNKDRVSIYIDGKYIFSLNLNQLLEFHLKSGSEINEIDLEKYKKLSQDGKLKQRALEWLLIRPHSARELHDYLKRKKLDDEAINIWVQEFQSKNYQNDYDFTEWWIEQRQSKKHSSLSIKHELKTKGVSDEIINQKLNDSALNDKEILINLIAKKRQQSKYLDDKKLIEYLMRQGFRYSLIKEVLAE